MLITKSEYARRHNLHRTTVYRAIEEGRLKTVLSGTRVMIDETEPFPYLQKPTEHHGYANTRLYNIWSGIKRRCLNRKDARYHDYGGRGVTVCDEWKNSFILFKDWAMSHGYSDELQIDRIDNDGGYCPENCRWVTAKENMKNQRPRRYDRGERYSDGVLPERVVSDVDFDMAIYRVSENKRLCRITDGSNIVTWCEFYPGLRGIY